MDPTEQESRSRAARVERRPATRAHLLTTVFTVAVAVAGIGVALAVPDHRLLRLPPGYHPIVIPLVVTIAFILSEQAQALIEFRKQAYSFSLTGIPMLVGLLYCPPHELIAARLVGSLVAFAIQRNSWSKVRFNTALYLLDTAGVVFMAHLLLPLHPRLSISTAVLCWLAIGIVDVVMSCLVMVVIRVNGGPISPRDAAAVLLPAAAFVVINTMVGFVATLLLQHGAFGLALVGFVVVASAFAFHGYRMLTRRHESLQVVQEFIERGEGVDNVEQMAAEMLGDLRQLVRARALELTLHGGADEPDIRIVSVEPTDPEDSDEPTLDERPFADGLPRETLLISARSHDPEHRAWLRERNLRDAAAVAFARDEARGMLVAVDRLGESATFSTDDLALMQALAGHLLVAMRYTELVGRLRHDAHHDQLTGLANRTLLNERLAAALAEPFPGATPALVLLDLDRFKEVNETLGHPVGDLLLQVVGQRLEDLMAETGATVARLGGDEFAVLLPTCPGTSAAVALAERMSARLRAPVTLGDVTLNTRAGFGIAMARSSDAEGLAGLDGIDLFRHADTAMYAAKAAGPTVTVYTPALDAGRAGRLALLSDLQLLLTDEELDVHFQPKLDLDSGLVTGVEALARWRHATRGQIPPDVFVPLAESTGLIDHLTTLVLARSLRECRRWRDQGLDLTVAVNLSARNLLNEGLPDEVAGALRHAGVPAGSLVLEITESSVVGDAERTLPVLERLRGMGITLSLDDFGTGYSSLSYLQRLPVQEVKIDRSFVIGMNRRADHTSQVLVRSIVNLGASLRLRIVAEGVEELDALNHLRELGCDMAQGWLIGRPVPADELVPALARADLRIAPLQPARASGG